MYFRTARAAAGITGCKPQGARTECERGSQNQERITRGRWEGRGRGRAAGSRGVQGAAQARHKHRGRTGGWYTGNVSELNLTDTHKLGVGGAILSRSTLARVRIGGALRIEGAMRDWAFVSEGA